MNRGRVTVQPQIAVSYQNPNNQALPSSGSSGSPRETILAILAAGAAAGYSASPMSWPGGHYPTAAIILAAAI